MEPRDHWQAVYRAKRPEAVSWYQATPEPSLAALKRFKVDHAAALIDIGGGASALAGELVALGWPDVTVLDISDAAIAEARGHLGEKGELVTWIDADIRHWQPDRAYDVWHDRAMFHFLTGPEERAGYGRALRAGTRPGSLVILATFALDGPEQCSGLPVRRYDGDAMAAALGAEFALVEAWRQAHVTPWGTEQAFQWGAFTRR
jgi:2-polyprenyl-3-methyl-5-hydroxy-6-metoxy-1,4-benzoquinol methylase